LGWSEDAIAKGLWALVEDGRVPSSGDPWTFEDVRTIARSVARYKAGDDDVSYDPKDPWATAARFVEESSPDGFVYHCETFRRWAPDENRWRPLTDGDVEATVWRYLAAGTRPGKGGPEPFRPTRATVSEVVAASKGHAHLASWIQPPCNIDGSARPGIIPFQNGLLEVDGRTLHDPDPTFYNLNALPFAYDPEAADPKRWHQFLDSVWGDDPQQIELVQEVIGYLMSGETRLQKMFLIVGPPRSGKGTIGNIIRSLLGADNCTNPTLDTIGENFGREGLIGKSLATISDARLHGRNMPVEELLAISGEDARSIPRKYKDHWEGVIPARILMLTNELPRLEDAAGALAARFVILHMTESFLGREDTSLARALEAELPGIALWALDGWDRVRARGQFIEPDSVREVTRDFADLGSPVKTFLRDRCVVDPECEVLKAEAYEAWCKWCEDNGRKWTGSMQMQIFGRDIRAAIPKIKTIRRKGGGRVWVGFGLAADGPDDEDNGDVPF
jgi:putative DNA primase/helicase